MLGIQLFAALSVSLLAANANAQAAMALGHGSNLLHTRLDPIVNPGSVSKHMHNIVGGSNFGSIYDPTHLLQSNCTTSPIPEDKSNYWTPTIYFKFNNGSYVIPNWGRGGYVTYYNNRFSDEDDFPGKVFAFPPGLTMLAGNNSQRGPTDDNKMAQSFKCLAKNVDKAFKTFPSLNGENECTTWRAQINFPSCWDGKRVSSDDNSHVSYVENGIENGKCPAGFKRIPSLFYEIFYDIDPDVMNPGTGHFVLSNGDTEGYSFHGDFSNGWEQDVLEDLVNTCYGKEHANKACDRVKFYSKGSKPCKPAGQFADEVTGKLFPITELPMTANIAIKNVITGNIVVAAGNPVDSLVQGSKSVVINSGAAMTAGSGSKRCAARRRRL